MVGGPAPPPRAGAVEIVRVDDRHAAVLAEFYRAIWDPTATPESVRRARAASQAANPVTPGADVPTFLFLSDGRALGHVTTIPVRLAMRGAPPRPGHWVKGLMVVPEHRNGPVGMLLLREAVKQLDLALAMVVQPAPRRLFQALGFADLGPIPNWIRVLRPGRVLTRLDLAALALSGVAATARPAIRLAQRTGLAGVAGAFAGLGFGLWTALRGGAGNRFRVTSEWPDAGDTLWPRVAAQIGAAPARDPAMLRWRYARDATYRVAGVVDRDLEGLAVVRAPRDTGDERLKGLRVATLSDLVVPPDRPEAGLAAIAAAERAARDLDADALLCSASHRSIGPLLRRRAFLPVGGNVHFMIRDPLPGASFPRDLGDWWLTRGDSSADEVF